MTEAASSKKRLVLIDGKSVFYRGYYAMPGLSLKDGTPTGGVYGFTVLSFDVIKKLEPDYVAVAWDKPKTNIRKRLEIYPDYKAGRKPAPPDFYAQIPILCDLLEALGWPLYELDDYEADDIMAGLAKKANAKGIEVILVTGDYDSLQLLNKDTHVYLPQKGFNIELFKEAAFEAKYGVKVEQFIDYKSIVGDSSDNIPGVPGVGPVAAKTLLTTYKTLDEIYENIELISGALKQKLIAGKDSAYMSKQLATMFSDAPIDLDLEAMDIKKYDDAALRLKLQELEFKSLLRQLPEPPAGATPATSAAHPAPSSQSQIPKLVAPQAADFAGVDELYIYARSRGAHGEKPSFVVAGANNWCTIIEAKDFKNYAKYFEQPLIGYDAKASIKVLQALGVQNAQVAHDVQVGAFLINSLDRALEFGDLAEQHNCQTTNLHDVPNEDIGEFAAGYIAALITLTAAQRADLAKMQGVQSLASKIEWPVIPVIARMERIGIGLDSDYLQAMSQKMQDQISDVEQTIYGHAEHEFNISSPSQLAVVLFDDLGLPTTGIKKGKTGYSTAATELDKLRAYHPIIDSITHYRELTKLKSTYVDALPKLVDEHGRLHTTFNMTVAQTGRLSSADPNLQNIPVRSELGRSIRTGFVARSGHVFVSADYSQFELRLAAVMAGDSDMIETFNSGADIHTRTAAEVYGVALDDVTKEMRSNAKTINFGVLYGMSPHGLAVATGMTFGDAKEFIDRYFASRQPLVDYIASLKKQAHDKGYVETLFGRRRPTPDVKSTNFIVRQAAERQAVNMPIQGTEADLMKLAMVRLDQELTAKFSKQPPQQLLQIHDSILVECREQDAGETGELMKHIMETIYPQLGIALSVDVHTGKNWGEL